MLPSLSLPVETSLSLRALAGWGARIDSSARLLPLVARAVPARDPSPDLAVQHRSSLAAWSLAAACAFFARFRGSVAWRKGLLRRGKLDVREILGAALWLDHSVLLAPHLCVLLSGLL